MPPAPPPEVRWPAWTVDGPNLLGSVSVGSKPSGSPRSMLLYVLTSILLLLVVVHQFRVLELGLRPAPISSWEKIAIPSRWDWRGRGLRGRPIVEIFVRFRSDALRIIVKRDFMLRRCYVWDSDMLRQMSSPGKA